MVSDDLRDLYQEVLLDHTRHPRNFGRLAAANRTAQGYNPLCGDRVSLFLDVDFDGDGRVRDIAFEGAGCAISTASASMMTEALKGKTLAEAREMYRRFHDMVTTGEGEGTPEMEKLVVFAGVRQFPIRVKCATLAWHALLAALEEEREEHGEPISTE
jgi:nitrogen fixation NifU-like protein